MKTKTYLIGRILRFLLGAFLIIEVWPVYMRVSAGGVLIRLGWTIGLVLIYIFLNFLISGFAKNLSPVIGAILSFVPLIMIFFIGYGGPAATGVLTFIAVSLIIASVRGDPGCEVMSIPAMITGKHTHLICLLFSPIDWIERKFH